MKCLILFLLPLMFLLSCGNSENMQDEKVLTLIIASKREKKTNVEETPSSRYIHFSKFHEDDEWGIFPYEIINLNYVEGYEYTLKVKQVTKSERPQDSPLFDYFLIEIINKEKKESENLPIIK